VNNIKMNLTRSCISAWIGFIYLTTSVTQAAGNVFKGWAELYRVTQKVAEQFPSLVTIKPLYHIFISVTEGFVVSLPRR